VGYFALCLEDVAYSSSYFIQKTDHGKIWVLQWITPELLTEEELLSRLLVLAKSNDMNESQSAVLHKDHIRFDASLLPQVNWLEESYRALPPIDVAGFFIYGSHFDGDLPAQKCCMQIEAATAFGSGEHGTTAGCLQALRDLKDGDVSPENVLDMGTGSGILAIAAHHLWPVKIVAVDIDPEAIRVTKRHLADNDMLSDDFICDVGEDASAPVIVEHGPFDLVIANILAEPLRTLAAGLCSQTASGGHVILSGMLIEQADSVLESYTKHGARLEKRYDIGEWSTLLLRK
jgi:ribosomal protein L11 methyltransferase